MSKIQGIINNLFGIDNNTSAPIIITLLVFISGYFIAYLFKFISGFLNRSSQRKLFYELLKEIAKTTLIQAENFEKCFKTLEITYEDNFMLQRENINHLSNLNKLNFESIHKAFFLGIENRIFHRYSRTEFNKIWSGISNLNYWETRYNDELNKFIKNFNFFEDKRNEAMDKFNVIFNSFEQNIHGKTVNKNYANYINELQKKVEKWSKIHNYIHYHVAQEHLVLPLIKHNNNYPKFEISIQLNYVLYEVSYYYDNMKNLLDTYKSIFQYYNKMYLGIGKTINTYIQNA